MPYCSSVSDTDYDRRKCSRRGISALELVIAATLLTMVASVTAMAALQMQRTRMAVMDRTRARQHVANVAERIQAMPFSDLRAGSIDTGSWLVPNRPGLASPSGELECDCDVTQVEGLDAKRIRIKFSYGKQKNVRLEFWRFAVATARGDE